MAKTDVDKSALSNLIISYPCPIKWDNISPEEREWMCSQCDRKVVNISSYSEKEAEKLLQNKVETGGLCVRIRIGSDGKVVTDNCPAFLKPVRKKLLSLRKALTSALLLVLTWIGSVWENHANASPKNCTVNSDMVSRFIKKSSGALIYKLKSDEGGIFIEGSPAPNDIREAVDNLIFAKPGNELILDLKKDVENTRKVDLSKLEKISDYYKQKKNYDKYFQANILRYLIYSKSPTGEKPPVGLAEIEVMRRKAIANYIWNAEKSANKREFTSAADAIHKAFDIAGQAHHLVNNKFLPDGVRIWKTGDPDDGGDLTQCSVILSESHLRRMIEVLKPSKKRKYLGLADERYFVNKLESILKSNKSGS